MRDHQDRFHACHIGLFPLRLTENTLVAQTLMSTWHSENNLGGDLEKKEEFFHQGIMDKDSLRIDAWH
jgi:hypothetical protein